MAQKMSCRDVALRLQTYLDGELDDARMDKIRAHLDACVGCGLEQEVFEDIKRQLSAQAIPADSAALERLRDFSAKISEVANAADTSGTP